MKRRPLLRRLSQGALQNVRMADFIDLVEGFGFRMQRQKGSHRVFAHRAVRELVNLQDVRGELKPYQIRQFLKLVEEYNLELEDES